MFFFSFCIFLCFYISLLWNIGVKLKSQRTDLAHRIDLYGLQKQIMFVIVVNENK